MSAVEETTHDQQSDLIPKLEDVSTKQDTEPIENDEQSKKRKPDEGENGGGADRQVKKTKPEPANAKGKPKREAPKRNKQKEPEPEIDFEDEEDEEEEEEEEEEYNSEEEERKKKLKQQQRKEAAQKRKQQTPKEPTDPKKTQEINRLKEVLKKCSIPIPRTLSRLTQDEAIETLKELLQEKGLGTNPSQQQIKDYKKKHEEDPEGIDKKNIISEGRSRRNRQPVNYKAKIDLPKEVIDDAGLAESGEEDEDGGESSDEYGGGEDD